jgi:hypothetical protein
MEELKAQLLKIRTLVVLIAEIGIGLVAIIAVSYLLLGENSGDYVQSVIKNLSVVVDVLKPETVVSVVLLIIAYSVIKKFK